MRNVEWLLREATGDEPLPVSEYTRVDDARWRAVIEHLEIGPGLRVFLVDAAVHRPLEVEPSDNEQVPWLGIGVAVTGRLRINFPDGPSARISGEKAALFRPVERRIKVSVPGRQALRYPSCGLRADRIERVFDGRVPVVLRPLLETRLDASRYIQLPATRRLRTLADALFARGFQWPVASALYRRRGAAIAGCGGEGCRRCAAIIARDLVGA